MAAKTTALTTYRDNGDKRTSTTNGHTFSDPKLVVEQRILPKGTNGVAEYKFAVVHGTSDADGNSLSERIMFEGKARIPVNGQDADVTTAKAVFDDLVASDEFTQAADSGEFLEDQS